MRWLSGRSPPSMPLGPETPPWHSLDPRDAIASLATDTLGGLTGAEAARRLSEVGANELVVTPPPPPLQTWMRHLREPVVAILLVAAVVAAVAGDASDAAAILAILVVNTLIGALQEGRAARALASLRRLSAPMARVIRDRTTLPIAAAGIVPGDRIEFEAGDIIPADARLIEASGLLVEEAAITGESTAVLKEPRSILAPLTPIGDRRNLVHAGTVVAAGRGAGVVVATGMKTQFGRIAGMLARPGPVSTPLQRRLAVLGGRLVVGCLVLVALIAGIDLLRGVALAEVLPRAVSLAVATVPEGLPAVVTVVLAVGMRRMAARNVLVRTLPSVETLGAVTVICTDKTGTLTRNAMTVREISTASGRYGVTGTGYEPKGGFFQGDEQTGEPCTPSGAPELALVLEIAARCTTVTVAPAGDGRGWRIVGDPTDGAIKVVAMKGGATAIHGDDSIAFELPFDSDRRLASVVVRRADGTRQLLTKGAPESVIARSAFEQQGSRVVRIDAARREALLAEADAMAARGLRVIALAARERVETRLPVGDGLSAEADIERDLVFAGLLGINDPPREGVVEAVRACQSAGVRPVVVTGDHPATAMAIARELGIIAAEEDAGSVMTGAEIEGMNDSQFGAVVDRIAVFARVSPACKLRIVEALQAHGHVVAMTGDGVNDAPALRVADIGIAMGLTGTDVTREAADMVLTDDAFGSILAAVEEGRAIDDNVRKVVHYLLACNVGEMLLMFVAAVAGWPAPLMPLQILWLNLVTDGLPALALGFEPPERGLMTRGPRPSRAPILSADRGFAILLHGLFVAMASIAAFLICWPGDRTPDSLSRARGMTFGVAAAAQLLVAVGCRSRWFTAVELGLLRNPWLLAAILCSALLQAAAMWLPSAPGVSWASSERIHLWAWGAGLTLAPLTAIEMEKIVRRAVTRCRNRPLGWLAAGGPRR